MKILNISTILKLCLIASILSFFISYNFAKLNAQKYNESVKKSNYLKSLR